MELISSLWLFVVLFTVAAALPGPAQGALIGQVISRGGKGIMPYVCGMVAGNALWLLLATTGLSAIALRFEPMFWFINWCGVLYLVYIAWKLWGLELRSDQALVVPSISRGCAAGLFVSLSNPKAILFFSAIVPQAIDVNKLSILQSVIITALGALIDFGIQFFYVFYFGKVTHCLQGANSMRVIGRGSACVMCFAAIWMLSSR